MMIAACFSLSVVTEKDELVYITGNTPVLGSWLPQNGVVLEKQTHNKEESNTWSRVVNLPGGADYEYRFFICRFLEDESGQQKLIVLRWESNLLPRKISTKNGAPELVVADFGNYGGHGTVSRGWMMGTTYTQMRLHSNPIYMWKHRHQLQIYRVKCIPMDYAIREPSNVDLTGVEEEESRESPPHCNKTIITCYSLMDESKEPNQQEQYGHIYRTDDYLVFESQTFTAKHLGYQLDFYVDEPNHLPRYVGYAYILPLNQSKSKSLGNKKIPINGLRHKPIGEVTVQYFITKPYTGHSMDLELSYRSHWKRVGRSLDVGHRGMGESYKKVALVRENTVASLSSAGTHGADLVEFDVMLCKDLHPIVYHDFRVGLLHRKRNHEKEDLLEIPVKDLTCEQLQSLRLYHASSSAEHQIHLAADKSDNDDLQPFPTLEQCLERVPPEIGFNIEIKYPLENEEGHEMNHYFDHNLQVDRILSTVFDHARSRRIIFASFDPETCIMLQQKQNKYPVLFLSNGPTQRYSPYVDYRTRDFDVGIGFALAQGLLGVDFLSEGLLTDLSVIKKTRDAGLVLFVWGADNNNQANIDLMRKHGVDGIIYDRFESPTDYPKWNSTYNATHLGPMCYQSCPPSPPHLCLDQMSEDCLTLNIWTPLDQPVGSGFAVMVFIHGGNFLSYSGGSPLFDGDVFVKTGGVILVTINYRLGAFGFLSRARGGKVVLGNYGLLDQEMAIKWTYDNIQAFGGDRSKITLFGQSAGAQSIVLHLRSSKILQYFQRAIIQSSPLTLPFRNATEAGSQTELFLKEIGCDDEDDQCLKSKSSKEILKAQIDTPNNGFSDLLLMQFEAWGPVIDRNYITANLWDMAINISTGKDIIIGTAYDEGVSYIYSFLTSSIPSYLFSFSLAMFMPGSAKVAEKYDANEDARTAMAEVVTDFVFYCPSRRFANVLSLSSNVWFYVFDQPVSIDAWGNHSHCVNKSCHGVDLPFLFDTPYFVGYNVTAGDHKLSSTMIGYWTNFAKYGTPNHDNTLPEWPKYSTLTGNPQNMVLKEPSVVVTDVDKSAKCTSLDRQGYRIKG